MLIKRICAASLKRFVKLVKLTKRELSCEASSVFFYVLANLLSASCTSESSKSAHNRKQRNTSCQVCSCACHICDNECVWWNASFPSTEFLLSSISLFYYCFCFCICLYLSSTNLIYLNFKDFVLFLFCVFTVFLRFCIFSTGAASFSAFDC